MSTTNVLVLAAAIAAFLLWTATRASAVHGGDHIVVNSTGDTTANDGVCTLREAITAANNNAASGLLAGECAAGASATVDRIDFNIPGPGLHTIQPTSALPQVTGPVVIDGTSDPDSDRVEINGAAAGSVSGLTVNTTNSTVKGLIVRQFGLSGLHMIGTGHAVTGNVLSANGDDGLNGGLMSSSTVTGNIVGLAPDGTTASGNADAGMWLLSNNLVGGTTPADRNVISSNANGIVVTSGSGNAIRGNYIGTDATGTVTRGNTIYGVVLSGSANNQVGGTAAGQGNLISGNGFGVRIHNNGSGNTIAGNRIGTNAAGTGAIANSFGVYLMGASSNTIGPDNVISGNTNDGVTISRGASDSTTVRGNTIGLGADGGKLANGGNGILVVNDLESNEPLENTMIGGTTGSDRNVVSGNAQAGILISGFSNGNVTGVTIRGNFIGPGADGVTSGLGNGWDGILVNGCFNCPGIGSVTIGGTTAGARNVISGNGTTSSHEGIDVFSDHSPSSNSFILVQGNYVGMAADGTTPLGNTGSGIRVRAESITIGGNNPTPGPVPTASCSAPCNLISRNGSHGLVVGSNETAEISGNYIGTDVTGLGDKGNASSGIRLEGSNVTVGAFHPATRNIISGNDGVGIDIGSFAHVIQGNYIGLGADGAADVGNASNGITISSSTSNTIGGTHPDAGNVISGNDSSGINISGTSFGNSVQGNHIGVDATGLIAKPNTHGVFVAGSANGNTIGGATTPGSCDGACNIISGNSTGVSIGSGTTGSPNRVRGNLIGLDPAGAPAPNTFAGITIDGGSGTEIGGSSESHRNVISSNGNGGGIFIQPSTAVQDTDITGNYIGVGTDGAETRGNSANGIYINSVNTDVLRSTIEGNTIARNLAAGIRIEEPANSADGHRITENSIHHNGNDTVLGIDLVPAGVTLNDPGDGDAGPNGLQNFPVLTAAEVDTNGTGFTGTLNGSADTTYAVELFSNTTCDGSHGEGEEFVMSVNVTTDGTGNASFLAISPAPLDVDTPVTATATDPDGNTSEFSACRSVAQNAPPTDVEIVTVLKKFSLDPSIPLSWTGTDPHGPVSYEVEVKTAPYNGDFGGYQPVYSGTEKEMAFGVSPGNTYCFRVTGTDTLGGSSPPTADRCTAAPVDSTSLQHKQFAKKSIPGAYMGTASVGKKRNATLTLSDVRADQLVLIVSKCPRCGVVKVSFRGVTKRWNTRGPKKRQVILAVADFGSARTGTVKIVKPSPNGKVIVEGLGVSAV